MKKIPYNRPSIVGSELEYIQQSIAAGHISGDGPFTKKCHSLLEQILGVPKTLLTTSCTHALEMTALLLEIKPGDEVIFPSFTFVSTVNAFVLRGARPIFVDIRRDTLNLDENLLEAYITPNTRAIIAMHYAGIACEMDPIMQISQRYNLAVVEDNAHGLFGKYKERYLGTFGCMATQSFHETKNFSCGEGGAIIINEPAYIERAEIIREKGTNRNRFFRGLVDKYTWVDIGSSYLPSDMLAAYLYAQLESWAAIQAKRKCIWEAYDVALRDWAEKNSIRRPIIPSHCEQAYHLYYLLLPNLEQRQAFISYLKEKGIMAVFHYLPLHLSQMGLRFGGQVGDCPVTEEVSDRLVRLPLFYDLQPDEQSYIIDCIQGFHN